MASDNAYTRAGVDIAEGTRAVELMKAAVRATYGPQVLAGIGAFGGLFDVSALKGMAAPVLVASTDGVGTKTKVAARIGRWHTIGQDLVNHCINDILVQGAAPLFFLDYVAMSKLDAAQVAAIVGGVAAACRAAGIALLGGETAEMPGVYEAGEIDLVGTIIGVVEKNAIIDGARVQDGDTLLALPSSGLHTNGFSLARRALAALDWEAARADLDGASIGDTLLAVHRSYLPDVQKLRLGGVEIRGLAHITGGGVIDNLPRILPPGLGAQIQRGTWPIPPIFALIQREGQIPDDDMFHVFNMGIGMLAVVPRQQAAQAGATLPEACVVGHIRAGLDGVRIV
ncbi:MAG: phosphoribosylformylglycinamidine cyclo-ligase [Chloroflexi bacterium]|nr:phosphoribosylformylglycinamidine cyclo-ligase [Chloroflexota bacterium]